MKRQKIFPVGQGDDYRKKGEGDVILGEKTAVKFDHWVKIFDG